MIYPEQFEHKTGFDQVRKKLSSLCLSTLGRDCTDSMAFGTNPDKILELLEQSAEMLRLQQSADPVPLNGFHDMTMQLRGLRVAGTFLSAVELMRLRRSLTTIEDVTGYFKRHRDDEGRSEVPRLEMIIKDMYSFPELCREIDRVLDRNGEVRDSASAELATIRRQKQSMAGSVSAAIHRVISRARQEGLVDADVTPAIRDGRLVLPISPMHKRKIQGIVHDESGSGKTVFIEPAEVVEANNRIRELELAEKREILRILLAVSDMLRPRVEELLSAYDVLGELDFIRAKALYAIEVNGLMPHLSKTPDLEWYHACHPVLLVKLAGQGKEIVPLDIRLSQQERILVISGPNAGGKSVCLKTVGIIQYMLQCGLLPPVYENSHCGIFDNILLDIGDDQSIEDDLSTYSSHLRSMRTFVTKGNDKSLILIDEFGGGTEPQIGGAIAQSILKRLNESHAWGVITTHYSNLKHYADETPGLINGSMLYDRQKMRPLFKLSIGNPGSSFALEIARQTGLPTDILSYAEQLVGDDYIRSDRYLLDIARDKRYWENKRTQIKQKEKKLEAILERYEADAELLRHQRREIIENAKADAAKIIDNSNAAVERAIREIRESQAERKRTIEARRQLREEGKSIGSQADRLEASHPLNKAPKSKKNDKPAQLSTSETSLAVGDFVKLDGSGTPGRILSIGEKNAEVAFGMLKTNVALSRLKRTMTRPQVSPTQPAASSTSEDSRQRQLEFRPEIDVRGMRVDEAVQAVTYFIDDAIQFNVSRVRILHGTGTGVLRDYLRRYLSTVGGVKHFADEHVQFGGAGITVVDLE